MDIPTTESGGFNSFFNSLSSHELDELWKNKRLEGGISSLPEGLRFKIGVCYLWKNKE